MTLYYLAPIRWLWHRVLYRLPHVWQDLLRICPYAAVHNAPKFDMLAPNRKVKVVNGVRWFDD